MGVESSCWNDEKVLGIVVMAHGTVIIMNATELYVSTWLK